MVRRVPVFHAPCVWGQMYAIKLPDTMSHAGGENRLLGMAKTAVDWSEADMPPVKRSADMPEFGPERFKERFWDIRLPLIRKSHAG